MGRIRPFLAITKATALEILSEPLSLLLVVSALTLSVLAPVFHYHQFGEASKMARESGLSAILTFGLVLAVFGTVRSFRREIESGTYQMALTHSVSPRLIFFAKMTGAFASYLVFVLILTGDLVTCVIGAEAGHRIALESGGLVTVWGPCVAAGLGSMLVPIILAAFLNRFARLRFVLTTFVSMSIVSPMFAVVFSVMEKSNRFIILAPAIALIIAFSSLFVIVSASASLRFKAHAAASVSGLALVILAPFIGNYYLADRLTNGGTIGWGYVAIAVGVMMPAYIAALVWGAIYECDRA